MRLLRKVFIAVGTLFLTGVAAQEAARAWLDAEPTGKSSLPFVASAQSELRQDLSRSNDFFAATRDGRQELDRLAKSIITANPLDATALSAHGKAIDLGARRDASPVFELAELVSRRSLVNQLELISAASRKGDVVAVLGHHDRALRIYPSEASAVIFASQAKALKFAQVRAALVNYANAPWLAGLVQSSMVNGAEPAHVVELVSRVAKQLQPEQAQNMREGLIAPLAQRNEFELVRAVIADMPAKIRNGLANFGFTAINLKTELAPLSWQLTQNGEIEASFDAQGSLSVRFSPETSGVVAKRTTLINPGLYELRQELTYPGDTARVRLDWTVHCQDGRTLLSRAEVRSAPEGNAIPVTIVIPNDCPLQVWDLSGVAQVSQFGSAAKIGAVQLLKRTGR
ncbi:hypothetical protein [Novosphingobium aquae]|uniref:LPP20 lipoprotein n=1 Tax=Novosphingobium aquae TaxID=3133435 RepID=A0ABU8SDX3_9SPHN